jgi:PAS domain S-box-containing protein
MDALAENERAVSKSREVSAAMNDLLLSLTEAETGQRGYLISGREEYLEPYYRGEQLIPVQLQRLRDLTGNDPYYAARLEPLAEVIEERRATLRRILQLHRPGANDAARELAKGNGRVLMVQVRHRFAELMAHEEEVLDERSRVAQSRYRSAIFTSLFGGILTIVMVAMATILVRMELRRRHFAEIEARQAAEHLTWSENRFRILTEAIPQMVWNSDASGRVTYFNRRWVEFTGLAAADAVASWWIQVAHPEDAPRVDNAWRRALANRGESFTEEVRVRDTRDDAYYWFMTTVVPINRPDGSVDQWIGSLSSIDDQKRHADTLTTMVQMRTVELESANSLLRDEIAERTRAEARAQATAVELARSNEELQTFAYVASHDLQEPLRKIQAFGDRLVKKYRDTIAGDGREYLDRMQAASVRMRTLINDLLEFSRVTTNAKPFAKVQLSYILRDVLDDLGERIEQTGAQIDVGEMPAIDADPVQMRRLFQNLIGNSLKFHKPGESPAITIRSTAIRLLPTDTDPPAQIPAGFRLTVADQGIGFDQTYADRIFELFQRLHGRGDFEGTGIGLAICRKIVQRHGGTIGVRSREGAGTTFYIDLPATTA